MSDIHLMTFEDLSGREDLVDGKVEIHNYQQAPRRAEFIELRLWCNQAPHIMFIDDPKKWIASQGRWRPMPLKMPRFPFSAFDFFEGPFTIGSSLITYFAYRDVADGVELCSGITRMFTLYPRSMYPTERPYDPWLAYDRYLRYMYGIASMKPKGWM